ncbi:MAG: alpha-L-fucosidase [Bacteroidia bacterium]
MKKVFLLQTLSLSLSLNGQTIKPLAPLPTPTQLNWAETEYYFFVHFGPNTFTNLEWGKGTEHEEVFNPTQLDCRQWCRIAKAAGAKGIIITAKHHDGFCLWPSKYSNHTVAQSKWKDGKGDVLKELSEACKEYNLKFGIYLSPWDRNHARYGTPEYNQVFVNMMKEVVEKYGPLFEFWWDGANGEGPNGKKQVYDFKLFERTMRSIAPNTLVFSDIGPDIRWMGNEEGIAGDPNWNLLDTAGFTRGSGGPPQDTLNSGNIFGKNWIPAECDVSIRPGWFYHEEEDGKVKTPEQLFNLYLKSVGRGANFLLNVPADRNGLFTQYDSLSLIGFKKLRDENFKSSLVKQTGTTLTTAQPSKNDYLLTDNNFKTYISLGNDYKSNYVEIKFKKPTALNCIVLQEPIQLGQRIRSFTIRITTEDGGTFEIKKFTIGHKRIVTFPVQTVVTVRIYVTDAKATPLIGEIDVYKIDDELIEKE